MISEVTHQDRAAFIAGLRAYAWWKDGVENVGTCGTTFKEAAELALSGHFDPQIRITIDLQVR